MLEIPSSSDLEAEKVFCIGFSKTGTTSLEHALQDLGYRLGNQHDGESLLPHYMARNFRPIVEFCLTADAFQDAPFCFPFTYIALDQSFPRAKFVLSVRDNPDQWYRSLVTFHRKVFGGDPVPTKEDLLRSSYCYDGFAWDSFRTVFNPPDDDLYDKATLTSKYEQHNAAVRDYFRFKSNLLEINLSHVGAYRAFCEFLDKEPVAEEFPWLNAGATAKNSATTGC